MSLADFVSPTPDFEAYYLEPSKDFYIETPTGYAKVDRTHLKSVLRSRGFIHTAEEGEQSEVELEIIRIVNEKRLIYAGPLAGYDAGMLDLPDGIVLVTHNCRPLEPIEGDWSDLERFIDGLFGEEQERYFYAWLKTGYESLLQRRIRPGQIMVFAGDTGSGKSLLQDLITLIFGREAKPFRYLTGKTTFNGDLFRAEHLVIGDEASDTDHKSRIHLGKELKQIAAEPAHSCHGKQKDAFTLRPFWRLTVSLNVDGENIMVLPPIDDSFEDKIIMLKASRAPNLVVQGYHEYGALKELFVDQLPAMLYWLTTVDVPEDIADQRWGVRAYQHPELVEALTTHSPEERMWDIIEMVIFNGKDKEIEVHTVNLQEMLQQGNASAHTLFRFPTACGVYLARIATKHDGRVLRTGRSRWKLVSAES